jgi:tripartite-type tricarboxylate transporter receptor subunit TctC
MTFWKSKNILRVIALSLSFVWSVHSSYAQTWPDKPVHLIIPFAPGGTTDIIGRSLAQQLSIIYKQNFIVENKAGAAGNIAAEFIAKSAPDGYNLMLASGSMMTVNPLIYKKLNFDYAKDFSFLTTVAGGPMVLVVSNKTPVKDFKEFLEYAKSKNLNFGSAGIGSQVHMGGENLLYAAGVNATHVPYKGEALALNDLISGQIDFIVANFPGSNGFIKSGLIKAIGVTSKSRMPQLPNTPTIAESGLPDFENTAWFALVGPAGMPQSVIDNINNATASALESETLKVSLKANGAESILIKQKDLESKIKKELGLWKDVINARKVTVQ